MRRLEIIVEQANLTIDQTRSPLARRRSTYHPSACPCGHTLNTECGTSCLCYEAGSECSGPSLCVDHPETAAECPCYQLGYEAERQPIGG